MSKKAVRVLLVEDHVEDAQVIQEVLSDEKDVTFDVTVAQTLNQGLKALGDGKADVVLLDLKLPDSDGLDTLAKLRERVPMVPVVVLTAANDEWMAAQALQRGAQDYLVKGYVQVYPNLLQRAMRYAIERKRSEETLRQDKDEISQMSSTVMDREQRILDLKREVNELLQQAGKPPKYVVS